MLERFDNYVKADDLIYQAYLILMNGDNPLSERDRRYAEEINKLGDKMLNSLSKEQAIIDFFRPNKEFNEL